MTVPRPTRRPAILAGLVLTLASTGAITATGAPSAAGEPAPPVPIGAVAPPAGVDLSATLPGSPAGGGAQWVTLISGDRVRVALGVAGEPSTYEIEPAQRGTRQPIFSITESDEGLSIVPNDAQPLINSGVLDPNLFNVRHLIENGYADSESREIPLLAVMADGPLRKDRAPALTAQVDRLPGAAATRALTSVGVVPSRVAKADASAFWQSVAKKAQPNARGLTPYKASLDQGVKKLRLERKFKAVLDRSVPQIGAPQAWAAGLDGSGQQVAVLDTGFDPTHPDLAGKVTQFKNFTAEASAVDGHGHGTHVASTVAGSGAASEGRLKGVAPKADLLVGKVLDNAGYGSESEIIAGMEWAVEGGADVVSMSLGGTPADAYADDLLAQSVDQLTASSDALFVIAAGNGGPGPSMGSPGVAASALTIAAVDRDDSMAPFSSRGPNPYNENVLKPDLAAPGVDIVAARAAGTSMGTPFGDRYTAASGTSMATPHVAGAAAIVRQQHPGWSAVEVKSALMSTSVDAGAKPFEQGAGRVDLRPATTATVRATTPNLDYGNSINASQAQTRSVSFANDGATAVTLELTATVTSAEGADHSNAFRLAKSTVTVAAGATADVDVTGDLTGLPAGDYSGYLTAVVAGSGQSLRVPLGGTVSPPMHKVKVSVLGRDGQPVDRDVKQGVLGSAFLFDVTTGNLHRKTQFTYDQETAVLTATVPDGTYHLDAIVEWAGASMPIYNSAMLLQPEIRVGGSDVALTLDARKAVQLKVKTPKRSESTTSQATVRRFPAQVDGPTISRSTFAVGLEMMTPWISPTGTVKTGTLTTSANEVRMQALVEMKVGGRNLPVGYTRPQRQFLPVTATIEGRSRMDLVEAPSELAESDPSLRGKLVLVDIDWASVPYVPEETKCSLPDAFVKAATASGVAGIIAYDSSAVCHFRLADIKRGARLDSDPEDFVGLPVVSLAPQAGSELRDQVRSARVTVDVTGSRTVPDYYHVGTPTMGRGPDRLDISFSSRSTATVALRQHGKELRPVTVSTGEATQGVPGFNGGGYISEMLLPRVTQHHLSPVGRAHNWQMGISNDLVTQSNHYRLLAGQRIASEVFATPIVPGAHEIKAPEAAVPNYTTCSGCRVGNDFYPQMVEVHPTDGVSNGRLAPLEDVTLTADGQPVEPTGTWFANAPYYQGLPAGMTTYVFSGRLRPNPLSPQEVKTTWRFQSSEVTTDRIGDGTRWCLAQKVKLSSGPCAAQPLLHLRYDLRTDLLDRVARQGQTIDIWSRREQTAGKPNGVRLSAQVSYDGTTWKTAKVTAKGNGHFEAVLPKAGAANLPVHLRTTTWDTDGNRTTQEVTHAATTR